MIHNHELKGRTLWGQPEIEGGLDRPQPLVEVPPFVNTLERAIALFEQGTLQMPGDLVTLWEAVQTEPGCDERRWALSLNDVPPAPLEGVKVPGTDNLVYSESRWSDWYKKGPMIHVAMGLDRDNEPVGIIEAPGGKAYWTADQLAKESLND